MAPLRTGRTARTGLAGPAGGPVEGNPRAVSGVPIAGGER
ncbi:hypothetical protein SBD_1128 [Streptomyces bottropensis ATCC 25435]|uniref:Uncharacterized protein n=1 Tax=Streptomyces bottropensis ATCC 25435 TaxID=1054862 RepID=M3EPM1_9ACTN|nr:hypothetical protein SBD_1128 [Streptomyces bottropensis ATCC 25435]